MWRERPQVLQLTEMAGTDSDPVTGLPAIDPGHAGDRYLSARLGHSRLAAVLVWLLAAVLADANAAAADPHPAPGLQVESRDPERTLGKLEGLASALLAASDDALISALVESLRGIAKEEGDACRLAMEVFLGKGTETRIVAFLIPALGLEMAPIAEMADFFATRTQYDAMLLSLRADAGARSGGGAIRHRIDALERAWAPITGRLDSALDAAFKDGRIQFDGEGQDFVIPGLGCPA